MAEALVADLENLGHDVWFDQDLSGGQVWRDQILATIRDCHVFVFVLEPNALSSTACKREFSYADNLGKSILPVLVANGVSTNLLPPELSAIHWVNYKQRDGNSIIGLVKALNNIPLSKPLPDPLPSPPEVPHSYLGGLSRKIDSAASLSYEDQSTLVFDLKAGLSDPTTRDDARVLLERLKKRNDLLAKIDREIDELLAHSSQLGSDPSSLSKKIEDLPEARAQEPRVAPLVSQPSAKPKTTLVQRLLGAGVGTADGAALGAIRADSSNLHLPDIVAFGAAIVGMAGAITGAITGTHELRIVLALAGQCLGFWIFAAAGPSGPTRFFAAEIFAGPIGMIVGAIVGTIIIRARGSA